MNDLYRAVHLHRQFKRFDKYSYEELVKMLTPSLNLDQYQIHRVGNQDVGFTNWAFLNDIVEFRFKTTGMLKPTQWNCGDNLWHIETLAKRNLKEIMSWTKNHFTSLYGYDKPIKWLRVRDEKIVKQQVRHTKPSWNQFVRVNG